MVHGKTLMVLGKTIGVDVFEFRVRKHKVWLEDNKSVINQFLKSKRPLCVSTLQNKHSFQLGRNIQNPNVYYNVNWRKCKISWRQRFYLEFWVFSIKMILYFSTTAHRKCLVHLLLSLLLWDQGTTPLWINHKNPWAKATALHPFIWSSIRDYRLCSKEYSSMWDKIWNGLIANFMLKFN